MAGKRLKQQAGFTLIELMIAVVIVGVLASLAFASYNKSVQKSRRSDAKLALTQAATLQEQWYFQFNSYTNDVTNLGSSDATLESPDGHYIVVVNTPTPDQYTLVATAVGSQLADTECRTMTLFHTGQKTAATNLAAPSTVCW